MGGWVMLWVGIFLCFAHPDGAGNRKHSLDIFQFLRVNTLRK